MAELSIYGWMFFTALVAGTFLPFLPASSELVLTGLLAARQGDVSSLIVAATVGNVLGAIINFFVGRYVSDLAGRRWFPVTEQQMERASTHFQRYGVWILLMTWLPVLGDVISVVAGLLRTDFKLFLVLMSIGKFVRYVVIAAGVGWFQ